MSAAHDGDIERRVQRQEIGRELTLSINALLRVIRVHAGANEATAATVSKLQETLSRARELTPEIAIHLYVRWPKTPRSRFWP
jgi:hypothetical protein